MRSQNSVSITLPAKDTILNFFVDGEKGCFHCITSNNPVKDVLFLACAQRFVSYLKTFLLINHALFIHTETSVENILSQVENDNEKNDVLYRKNFELRSYKLRNKSDIKYCNIK